MTQVAIYTQRMSITAVSSDQGVAFPSASASLPIHECDHVVLYPFRLGCVGRHCFKASFFFRLNNMGHIFVRYTLCITTAFGIRVCFVKLWHVAQTLCFVSVCHDSGSNDFVTGACILFVQQQVCNVFDGFITDYTHTSFKLLFP